MGLLDGKVAIVTGAAQGIGHAIAQTISDRGASVVLADTNADQLHAAAAGIRQGGSPVAYVGCDITSTEGPRACCGPISTSSARSPCWPTTRASTVMPACPRCPWPTSRPSSTSVSGELGWGRAPCHLRCRPGAVGRSSTCHPWPARLENPGTGELRRRQGRARGPHQSRRRELAGSDVRVNAIQPGLIRTAITMRMKPGIWAAKQAEVPLGRARTPEEAGVVALFLASALPGNVTCSVLEVSGDRGM
jgi:3-oxoacyl-[acyl-carrier protein] reductase